MRKFIAFLCTSAIITSLILPYMEVKVNADQTSKYYTEVNELSGIKFSSVDKMKSFLTETAGLSSIDGVEPEISDYLLEAENLYLPNGFSDKTNSIQSILITPDYVDTTFKLDSISYDMYYYYDKEAGKTKLEYAQYCVKNGTNSASSTDLSNYTVYYYERPYFESHESYYIWQQDEEYFMLRIGTELNDKYINLCSAEKYSLLENFDIKTGLQKINGKIYYVNNDGSYAKGWKTIGGNNYYFTKTGEAVTKNTIIGGTRYKFTSDGVCKGKYSGWVKKSGKYYYYSSGKMQKNRWLKVNGEKTYYLTSDGSRAVGKVKISGIVYTFDENGKVQ